MSLKVSTTQPTVSGQSISSICQLAWQQQAAGRWKGGSVELRAVPVKLWPNQSTRVW